ncbi:MAG: hypothetical protein WC249_01950 [Patescibacteria group bacterium]|jgi:hypothetical protein
MIIFLKKYKYLLFLIIIAFVSHLQWFNPFSILNSSDWTYWPDEAVKQLYNSYGAWINFFNLGSVNIQIPFNFFNSIWSLITNLCFSYDFSTKITFLIPIAILGFISPYILFKKLTKNEFISFITALFYGTTTHFLLRQTAHMPIAFVYALAPLIFYCFVDALKKNKFVNWLIFILIFFVGICYEIRIMYIICFILFFYFLFFHLKEIKKYFKMVFLPIILFIFLNLFWLLPVFFGGFVTNIQEVANRGLFGNFLHDLRNSFTLSESLWTGGLPNNQFVKQPVIWYFWFLPIIVFCGFLFKKDSKYKKEILLFGLISLIGIFLTKQSAEPLPGTYLWLYNNFPGFNLFRESYKFYLIIAIGYAGLLAYTLLLLKENKNKILNKYIFYIFSIVIVFIAIFNVKPLITGEVRTMFISKHIPQDYFVLKGFVLNQTEYFRTMWIPRDSHWGIYTNQKPKINDINTVQGDWKNFVDYQGHSNKWLVQEQILDVLRKDFSNQLFNVSSIKYVIVPLQDKANDDDFFIKYGGDKNINIRQWYIDQLNKIKWLHKINIDTKDLVVYENQNYRPHLYLTKQLETIYKDLSFTAIDWQFKNPTKYTIKLNNISQPVFLNFSEAYHPNWKLRLGKINWFSVLLDKNYFIPDSDHFKNDATLNSFYLDLAQICVGNKCERNSDGSYNLELTLYFQPQSYFYLGLIISGTTLVGCLGYLGWDFVKRRKKKKEESENIG